MHTNQPLHEVRKLAGQVLVAGFGSPDEGVDPRNAPQPLLELAAGDALGGVILFRRNLGHVEETAELVRTLRAGFVDPNIALVAVDQEGGRVARLGPPVLQLPPMAQLGAIDDPSLTRRVLTGLGQQLHTLGFNVNMAPVLDVDTNPDNPIIGDRSFGDTPERVIRHASAAADGLAAAGVAACGKHFPGHGDTLLDSHLALPRLTHDRERLQRVELRPFAALARYLPSLMTAHVVFEGLAPEVPATLSHAVMTGLLREQLGFEGLVFSDDLEMKALADHYSVAEAACGAIEAGCDALLICSEIERTLTAHAALTDRAMGDGAFRARLAEAAGRVKALGRRFPGRAQPACPPADPELEAALAHRLGQASA